MQQTQSPSPEQLFRAALAKAQRAIRNKIGRGRFTKRDADYDFHHGRVTIGVWLLDRRAAEYRPHFWPIRHATLHWRRYEIVVESALNFEFQIDRDVPFAQLSAGTFEPTTLTLFFGDAMRIKISVSTLDVTCRRSETVRTDWGVKRWTLSFSPHPPVLTTRGS
ncbi:MAG: hypothetical protein M3Z41_00705 [Candidatus Eremiobacteraeota bacterium]|nr:hypothetical protein [Candidatus Eremiobacteraeota bacterium]